MDNLNETRIRVIPGSDFNGVLSRIPDEVKVRVAAYCRVSTDNREQESSYEAQVKYFEKYIGSHENWELVGIYADPGLSGKNMKRPEFQRMMSDAREGKIDRILAKSVSRFARNTLDCVACCRELKDLGIGVNFEKESIDTMDPSSPFTLTIMASLAEEESRSISSNIKWGVKKKMMNGTQKLNTEHLFAYYYDEDGNIKINEDEAKIVREIFRDYASGMSYYAICEDLADKGIINKYTNKPVWTPACIKSTLKNEKYMGDMRLQKTFRPDFLSRQRYNNGEVESYYIENHHTPIIDPSYFKMVQYLIKRGEQLAMLPSYGVKKPFGLSALSRKIYCGDCGNVYVSKTLDRRDGQLKGWQCSRHKLSKDCPCIPIKEKVFTEAIKTAFKTILENRDEQMEVCDNYVKKIKKLVFEREDEFNNKIEELMDKIDELSLNTADYSNRIFVSRLDEIRMEIANIKAERDRVIPSLHVRRLRSEFALGMKEFINVTEEVNDENIEEAINKCIEKIIVKDNDLDTESIDIIFLNGHALNVKLINPKKRKCIHRVCYRERVDEDAGTV